MTELIANPKATAEYSSGTGIWITSSQIGADGMPANPVLISRWTAHEVGSPSVRNVGYPTYQFRMVRNFEAGAGTSSLPSHVCLLHLHTLGHIYVLPVLLNGDVAASQAYMASNIDLSAVSTTGTALAAVPIPSPTAGQVVTSIMSIPTGGDLLGVEVFAFLKTGHVAPASPSISGTDLGFSGGQLLTWTWKGFVAERTEADPDVIRVFGGLVKTGARAGGIGDLSAIANYVFEVSESTGALVSPAVLVNMDVAVIPSQMVQGSPVALSGGGTPTWWIIGRSGSEFYSPLLDPSTRPPGSPKAAGVSSVGSLSIWTTQDATWATWRQTHQLPTGVSHMPVQHLDDATITHHEAPRDVGLSYHSLPQLLIPHTVDTDTGQDPVCETGKKAFLDDV